MVTTQATNSSLTTGTIILRPRLRRHILYHESDQSASPSGAAPASVADVGPAWDMAVNHGGNVAGLGMVLTVEVFCNIMVVGEEPECV